MNAPDIPYRPLLSDAARPATFRVPSIDETGAARETPVAGEHPLTLYVDKQEILTLMTLGAAPEALAIGYLRNQRLVERHRGHRLGAGRLGRQRRRGDDAPRPRRPRRQDAEAHQDHRLRPGHRVRRPDGRDRHGPAARRRHAVARDALRAARPRAPARDDLQAGGRRARLRARDQRRRRFARS